MVGTKTIIRVEIESESVILDRPAKVFVYKNNKLVAEIVAKIKPRQGADGDYYPAVELQKKEGAEIPEEERRKPKHIASLREIINNASNICPACEGTGGTPSNPCKTCDGTGQAHAKPM